MAPLASENLRPKLQDKRRTMVGHHKVFWFPVRGQSHWLDLIELKWEMPTISQRGGSGRHTIVVVFRYNCSGCCFNYIDPMVLSPIPQYGKTWCFLLLCDLRIPNIDQLSITLRNMYKYILSGPILAKLSISCMKIYIDLYNVCDGSLWNAEHNTT